MKCITCDKEANPKWRYSCDECEALGTFFQYEQDHLWSSADSEAQFLSKLKSWKETLSKEDKDWILDIYWTK